MKFQKLISFSFLIQSRVSTEMCTCVLFSLKKSSVPFCLLDGDGVRLCCCANNHGKLVLVAKVQVSYFIETVCMGNV